MKKLLFFVVTFIAVFAVSVHPAVAAKPLDNCHYVVDGNIPYPAGHTLADDYITTGYDIFGYNYQAHVFNGTYANAYLGRSGFPPYTGEDESYLLANPTAKTTWMWPFRNVNLQMKWNDAWLANKDCGPDGTLDRPDPVLGSGAWLTNHATGTYTSSTDYRWDISGTWLLDFAGGTDNREFRSLVQDVDGNVTGEFWWLNGANFEYGGTLEGTLVDDTLTLHYVRPAPYTYFGDFVGTVGVDEITAGSFSDSDGNDLLWTATGASQQVYDTCTVSDFVKIIAPPLDAKVFGSKWYTVDNAEIGPVIWGDFAIIKEIASDPCGEYGVIDYMSPLRKGLGNW